MTHPARRIRRWMMGAGPGMILCGWRLGVWGAAAFLLLWMAVGAATPGMTALHYAPRRRIRLHRLFLGFAVDFSLLCGFSAAGNRLLPPSSLSAVLLLTGAVSFSLILGQQTIRLSLPERASWWIGCALCAASSSVLFMP